MSKLKKIIYEFKLKLVKRNLRKNAEEMYELIRKDLDYQRNYNEQLRLMSCSSYLENELSRIK